MVLWPFYLYISSVQKNIKLTKRQENLTDNQEKKGDMHNPDERIFIQRLQNKCIDIVNKIRKMAQINMKMKLFYKELESIKKTA